MKPELVKEIREAIAARLGDIGGRQAVPYLLSSPTPPTVWVFPGGAGDTAVEYDQTMGRGLDSWEFTVQAFVGLQSDQGAQMRLDELLAPSGPRSVKQVLETKAAGEHTVTLGGVIRDLRVTSATGYRTANLPSAQAPVLECSWFLTVYAKGT